MGRNGEESVEKKCTSNLDTGLIRGIILMIIQRISPVSKITGYLFTYGLFAAFSS